MSHSPLLTLTNATLSLPAGRYVLSSLKLNGTSELRIESGAEVHLFVTGSVNVSQTSYLCSSDADLLVVTVADTPHGQTVTLRNSSGERVIAHMISDSMFLY